MPSTARVTTGSSRLVLLKRTALALVVTWCGLGCATNQPVRDAQTANGEVIWDTTAALLEGKRIFRFDTFGDEQFWTDTARMHEVVQRSVSPATALAVGLKVDADVIPTSVAQGIRNGTVDLTSPAVTVALLKLGAVVGLKGTVATIGGRDTLMRLGITCALCHSTVDNSFSKGIGRRLDGWPNRDLNVGAIIALSPAVAPAQKAIYTSWGPGKYDPRFNIDGRSTPLVLPPAYGLRKVSYETYSAEGPISYWNAYVAITQMHGRGNFVDERLGVAIRQTPDLVTSKLPALRMYQHSLSTPEPPPGSYDVAAAGRGRAVFDRSCISCHVGYSGTDNNAGVLHKPAETGMNGAYAARTATKAYRTTPLRGLWQHPPYFHDGSAPTLEAVVEHYTRVRNLDLTSQQKADLVQFLKSL